MIGFGGKFGFSVSLLPMLLHEEMKQIEAKLNRKKVILNCPKKRGLVCEIDQRDRG